MGGSFQLDRVIQATSGAVDELSFQAEQKIKATANEFHYYAINGTKDASGTGYATGTFDGLAEFNEAFKKTPGRLRGGAFCPT